MEVRKRYFRSNDRILHNPDGAKKRAVSRHSGRRTLPTPSSRLREMIVNMPATGGFTSIRVIHRPGWQVQRRKPSRSV